MLYFSLNIEVVDGIGKAAKIDAHGESGYLHHALRGQNLSQTMLEAQNAEHALQAMLSIFISVKTDEVGSQ